MSLCFHAYLHVIVVIKGERTQMRRDEGKLRVRAYTLYFAPVQCTVDLQFTVVLTFPLGPHHEIGYARSVFFNPEAFQHLNATF